MNIRTLLPNAVLSTVLLLSAGALRADLVEDFDNFSALSGQGWAFTNLTPSPSLSWFPGNSPATFPAQAGAPNSYAAVNYQSTTASVETLSNWMLTPELTFQNGDVISFYTRTMTGSVYPDRLELRLSTSAASVNVGSTPTSVGEFTTLLLTINPTLTQGGYPTEWTQYTVTLSGLAGVEAGRLGFRYFVTNGGLTGVNSNYIGVDTLRVTSTAVPEPSTYAIGIAALLGAMIALRRRARA